MIKYPSPLKTGDTIGITAPSSGVTGPFSERLDNSINHFKELGYECLESKSVRMQEKLASNTAQVRALEFMSLYMNDEVKIIIPPWGGLLLIEILPYIDFETLKTAPPKWVLGFSDTSVLLFSMLTVLDVATVHGPNALDFGAEPVHESVLNSLELLNFNPGEVVFQHQCETYQKEWKSIAENSFVPYNLEGITQWKSYDKRENLVFEGRLIGGCLDVLCKLIGTPYADVNAFINRNNDCGFIWYFESCDMSASDISVTLTQMKMCGWFKNCKGILFGRLEGYKDTSDYTFMDAISNLIKDVDVPVLYDLDIGHVPPQITLINGAVAKVELIDGIGVISQELR